MYAKALLLLLTFTGLLQAQKITYDDHIRDIFSNHCSQCHKPSKSKGGLNLMSYQAAIKGSSSGAVLEASNPDSLLMECINFENEDNRMPPKGPKMSRKGAYRDVFVYFELPWKSGFLTQSIRTNGLLRLSAPLKTPRDR